MSYINVPLLVDNGDLDQTGSAVSGDAHYGFRRGLHTVSARLDNFTGRIYIEATLSAQPGESDWFPLWTNKTFPFAQYPRDIENPNDSNGDTGLETWNFTGNFTALRARVQRSHIETPPEDLGRVIEIKMSI